MSNEVTIPCHRCFGTLWLPRLRPEVEAKTCPDCVGRCDPKECKHEGFTVNAAVNRLQDSGRFQADIRVVCIQCGTPFRFLGLPAGLDLNGAAVSVDGTEGRFAIGTPETVANIIDGDCPVGFTVSREPKPIEAEPPRLPPLPELERAEDRIRKLGAALWQIQQRCGLAADEPRAAIDEIYEIATKGLNP